MARDDAFGEFRELLLLQRAPLLALLGAGALALYLFAVAAVILLLLLHPAAERDLWEVAAALAYSLLAGAVAAVAYRRGHIPYRRGDFAAAAAFTIAFIPAVLAGGQAAGQDVPFGAAVVVSILPALALEVCWRPLFAFLLRRLSGLKLNLLVHEALREHYGDDWQAYTARISADLREARRLRDLVGGGTEPKAKS